MAKHRISERYTRLRRRMWRRVIAGGVTSAFIAGSLVLDCSVGRISPERWIYAHSFFTVIKAGYFDGRMYADETEWRADVHVNASVMTSWSDLYGRRIPPVTPKAWAQRGGWINVIIPMWPVPAFLFGSASVWWRLASVEKRRHLCRCGYSLAGLSGYDCPECGRTIKKLADA